MLVIRGIFRTWQIKVYELTILAIYKYSRVINDASPLKFCFSFFLFQIRGLMSSGEAAKMKFWVSIPGKNTKNITWLVVCCCFFVWRFDEVKCIIFTLFSVCLNIYHNIEAKHVKHFYIIYKCSRKKIG